MYRVCLLLRIGTSFAFSYNYLVKLFASFSPSPLQHAQGENTTFGIDGNTGAITDMKALGVRFKHGEYNDEGCFMNIHAFLRILVLTTSGSLGSRLCQL